MIGDYLDTAELKRLLSALLVVVGGLFLVALFAVIVVPGLRNANRPPVPPEVPPVGGQTGWLAVTEYPPSPATEIPPVKPEELLADTPAVRERGRVLFEKNCASCHGPSGVGDGPASKGLAPPPRNFTRPEGWKRGTTVPALFETLEKGVAGSAMGAYEYLPVRDRMALIRYVQSLGAFDHGDTPEALLAFARPFASAGQRIPARIPVSRAEALLRQEYRPVSPLELSGSEALRRIVEDPVRAAEALRSASAWRQGPSALARYAAEAGPASGFSPQAAFLTAPEWEEAYRILAARFGVEGKGGHAGWKEEVRR